MRSRHVVAGPSVTAVRKPTGSDPQVGKRKRARIELKEVGPRTSSGSRGGAVLNPIVACPVRVGVDVTVRVLRALVIPERRQHETTKKAS